MGIVILPCHAGQTCLLSSGIDVAVSTERISDSSREEKLHYWEKGRFAEMCVSLILTYALFPLEVMGLQAANKESLFLRVNLNACVLIQPVVTNVFIFFLSEVFLLLPLLHWSSLFIVS